MDLYGRRPFSPWFSPPWVVWTPIAAQQGATDGQWRYYGGGPGGTAYSPLDQIDATNVGDLEIAGRWAARNQEPRPEVKNSTTPVMVYGVLYATAGSRRNVVALDAGTGGLRTLLKRNAAGSVGFGASQVGDLPTQAG